MARLARRAHAWRCRLCRRTYTTPAGARAPVEFYMAAHLFGHHRCEYVRLRLGLRCTLIAPHRYRHHVFSERGSTS